MAMHIYVNVNCCGVTCYISVHDHRGAQGQSYILHLPHTLGSTGDTQLTGDILKDTSHLI